MTFIEVLRQNIGIVAIACLSAGLGLGLYIGRPGDADQGEEK